VQLLAKIFSCERPDFSLGLKWIADLQGLHTGAKKIKERIVYLFVNDESFRCDTALSAVNASRTDGVLGRNTNIGIGKHDIGVRSAQLQNGGF